MKSIIVAIASIALFLNLAVLSASSTLNLTSRLGSDVAFQANTATGSLEE